MVTTHFGLKSDNSKGTTNEKYFFLLQVITERLRDRRKALTRDDLTKMLR